MAMATSSSRTLLTGTLSINETASEDETLLTNEVPMANETAANKDLNGGSHSDPTLKSEEPDSKAEQLVNSEADDLALIRQAEESYSEEKLFLAARLLRQVQNKSLLQEVHHEIISNASLGERVVVDLTSPPEEGWTKQGESHGGHRDSIIYYKLDENLHLKCRLESPIESSLLVPLMSVFNESELYETWMPRFHIPFKMGVRRSLKLLQQGRCHQIIQVTTDVPWPLAPREIVISAMAMDDIEEHSHVAVKMTTLHPGETHGGVEIPAAETGIVRMDFDGGLLFRECPKDHPSLARSKTEYPKDQHLLLCSLTMHIDAKVSFVPQALINFVTRTAVGKMWQMLLHVAEEVRDGKRPKHAEAIIEKKELYDWIVARIDVMFDRLAANGKASEPNQEEKLAVEGTASDVEEKTSES